MSSPSTTACLKAAWPEDSTVTAKRDPICTPAAPRTIAAAICAPVAMPPAATTGIDTAATHRGTSTMVVSSSRPL